jgi:predicted ABC-type ATPase
LSTTAPAILRDALKVHEFVNADTIAAGLSAFSPESVALAAGRIMLDRVHELARERRDFAFETTLASRTFAPWLKGLQTDGYTSTWCICAYPLLDCQSSELPNE